MSNQQAKQIQYLAQTVARLEGEVFGTQAAIRALILAHDDPRAAQAAVAHQIETVLSIGLPSEVDEAFLDGVVRAKQRALATQRDLDELHRE